MPMFEGKNKYSKGGIPLQLDAEGNLILSSESIIDVDDIDTISEVVKVTTVGTITNTVTVSGTVTANQGGAPWSVTVSSGNITVSGTVAATQSGTWNIGTVSTVSSVTDVVNVQDVDNITGTVKILENNRFPTNMYNSGYLTMESGMDELEFDELTVSYDGTYLDTPGVLTVSNLSTFYDLNVQVRQVLTIGGNTLRLATHQFSAPPVAKIRPTTDAYSSCVLYNATGPAWTDESEYFEIETGYDFTFPITEVNDAIYFGCKSKFNSLSIYITTAGVYDATLVWEFWNGSTWVSPTVLIDNSNELQSTGGQYYIVLFEALTNWAANQPDAASMVNQYWMRLRCSAFNSVTTNPVIRTVLIKPVQNNAISSFDLNEIYGNASTTTQLLINPSSDIDDTHEIIYNVSIGAR